MSQPSDEAVPPLSRDAVAPIVEPHLGRLGAAIEDAWAAFTQVRVMSAYQMAQASAGARGMLVADFLREPVHRRFAKRRGAYVDDRYGRPWVNLCGGLVQIRFKKLTPSLDICPSDTERQTRLAFHLGDPYLPDMPEATILTAGYVLDVADQHIAHLALVCHIGSALYYSIRVPGGNAAAGPVTQLPLTPLSPPVIRSARKAAQNRLQQGHESQ